MSIRHPYGWKEDRPPFWKARVPVYVVAALLSIFTFFPMYAQLQQSGGGGSNPSVGATAAAAPTSATLAGGTFNSTLPTLATGQMGSLQLDSSGRLIAVGAGTAGSAAGGVVSVQGVASGTTVPITGTLTAVTSLTNALPAGTNAIGTVRTNPLTSCGSTIFDSAITTIPTTEAAATATTTCVQAIYVNNLTSSAQTFSIKDNAATPIVIVNAFSLPGNSNMLLTFGGIKFNLGVRWVATNASAVNAQILGYQ